METYNKKRIYIEIHNLKDTSVYKFEKHAMSVSITKPSRFSLGEAQFTIYGLNINVMTALAIQFITDKNVEVLFPKVFIRAGTMEGSADNLPLIFVGDITNCQAEFNGNTPALSFKACASIYGKVIPDANLTITQPTLASKLIEPLAKKMGHNFKLVSGDGMVKPQTFEGNVYEKIQKICEQINSDFYIDCGTVELLKRLEDSKLLYKEDLPVISKDTGMIGFPKVSSHGLSCECYFNPNIANFYHIKVESLVPQSTGYWLVIQIRHDITANHPTRSSWKTIFNCSYPESNADNIKTINNKK